MKVGEEGNPVPLARHQIVGASVRPELIVDGEIYRLTWSCGIEADVERFAEHRDELIAEVTIRHGVELLHSARLNLTSTQARQTLVKSLTERDPDPDWPRLIETMCFQVRERYREGEPPRDLREPLAVYGNRWLVEPFVERGGSTILFADGGTGKSLTALAVAMTVASGCPIVGALHGDPRPVLYLDWETSVETTLERFDAIAAGARLDTRPEVYYRRMTASLVEAAGNIRRDITTLGIGFVVVDSLGAARAGEPESAEVTIKMFNAARSLGVPWLGIDHVTKSAGKATTRPFGSTYTHNLARLTWSAEIVQEEGENILALSLTNRKRNNGRLLGRTGLRIEFERGAIDSLRKVTFRTSDLAQMPGLADNASLKARIIAELNTGPQYLADVAKRLGQNNVRAVSARAGELVRAGVLGKLPDGRFAIPVEGYSDRTH